MPQIPKLRRRLTVDETELPSVSAESPPCTPVEQKEAWVFQPEGHPKQAMIDGEIWPPIFKPEFVRTAKKIVPVASDVFVCTYPKCGTTWIQQICTQLMNREPAQVGKEMSMVSPMIERMGGKYAEDIPTPRLLKTHFTYANCPKSSKAKYIFCVRNPKDCLTSYFHHNRNFKIYDWAEGDFDVFFELFYRGELAFGDYFTHLLGWLPHADDENVLFLTYEDMYADLESAVVKIGNFLGGHAAEIVNDAEQLARVVDESKIDSMKKNQGRWFPSAVLRQQNFIRKGGSRDWKNYFTREQSDRMDALFRKRMAGSIAENWWQSEMAWDEEPEVPTPEITLTEAEEADLEVDEIASISRRASVGNVEMLTASGYKGDRRGSVESLVSSASSGYISDVSCLSA